MTDSIQPNEMSRTLYESRKSLAVRDLTLKKIFFATVIVMNIAALSGLYTYLRLYCPFKAEPIITTSFIVGIIGGMITLKIPTFGINNYNLSQYLNPVTMLGRLMAYAFFGPTLLLMRNIDWTKYNDPNVANEISGELKSKNFEQIATKYDSFFSNLFKYGFLPEDKKENIENLLMRYRIAALEKKDIMSSLKKIERIAREEEEQHWKNPDNPLVVKYQAIQGKMRQLNEEWKREIEGVDFPNPELEKPDYSKRCARWLRIFTSNFQEEKVQEGVQ